MGPFTGMDALDENGHFTQLEDVPTNEDGLVHQDGLIDQDGFVTQDGLVNEDGRRDEDVPTSSDQLSHSNPSIGWSEKDNIDLGTTTTSYFLGKVIAIASGDSGMCKATSEHLRHHGARVSWASFNTANARNIPGLNAARAHKDFVVWYIDVRDEQQVERWIKETIELWGDIHGCVNFGGGSSRNFLHNTIKQLDISEWQRTVDHKLTGSCIA
ncbi:hypothetical protein EK21DRAFT_111121 [Setomelanomma holmii]|uniref:Uncharacterized protein n=1 Tax=Setomelanomma holmii TaxID=210430 RepID=A0A9P4HDY0_9PLEO|nr:hypothetical protein EK21DRAFT_111121 [Setomelanomma holmii]